MPERIRDFDLEDEGWDICGCTGGGGGSHKRKYTTRSAKTILSFEEIVSYENLLRAWEDFIKGKRGRKDVNTFAHSLSDNLWQLYFDIKNGAYAHGPYDEYTICDPKKRTIHKASVRDRVVHRLVYNAMYQYFDTLFIYDSFSSRKGKGTHRARNRFKHFTDKVSKNYTKQCFVLKFDIQKCFASIDQSTLLTLLKKHVIDDKLFDLVEIIIKSFERGLPLGNLTSQLFVNIYLHELDLFCKHKLHLKYYLRYADDIVIVSGDRYELDFAYENISVFLKEELFLMTHKRIITTIYRGVDILGVIFFPRYDVLRKRTRARLKTIAH